MYRIAVVEDELSSINKIASYVVRYAREHKVELKYDIFKDGLEFISKYSGNYDVVLMDIEMPLMNGLETAKRLRKIDEDICLIFVTNLAKYAIEGYAVQAMDFMVKPVEYQNFSLKLDRAIRLNERKQSKDILLSTIHGVHRLLLNDIYYIEVLDHKLTYHTSKGLFTERKTINERENDLEQYGFERCSKSFLVNLQYVDAVVGNEISIKGELIPISRAKKTIFLTKLAEFMGDSLG